MSEYGLKLLKRKCLIVFVANAVLAIVVLSKYEQYTKFALAALLIFINVCSIVYQFFEMKVWSKLEETMKQVKEEQ